MKSTDEDTFDQENHHPPLEMDGQNDRASLGMEGYDEETLDGNSTLCGTRDEMTGSPALRMKELRLTLLCWYFSIKFFQMTFSAAFTLIAIQRDDLNDLIARNFWTGLISGFFCITSYYCLKRVRYCRRFPINLLLLVGVTLFMAFTFSALAIHIWPLSYSVLVALITAATIFFLIIPAALVLKVDENGYGMYKHIGVTMIGVAVFAQLPYFLSIGPRYDVDYGIYMLNVCSGAVLGALLCLEGFFLFKRHMNSGRLTSLANLEGIFSASVS